MRPGAQEKGDRKGQNAEWGWGRPQKNRALAGSEQQEQTLTVNRPVCDLTGGSCVAEPAGFPTSQNLQFSGGREGQLAGGAQPGHGAVEESRKTQAEQQQVQVKQRDESEKEEDFFFPTFSIRRVQGTNMEKLKIKPKFTAEPQN